MQAAKTHLTLGRWTLLLMHVGINDTARGALENITSVYLSLRSRAKVVGPSRGAFDPADEWERLRLESIHLVRQPLWLVLLEGLWSLWSRDCWGRMDSSGKVVWGCLDNRLCNLVRRALNYACLGRGFILWNEGWGTVKSIFYHRKQLLQNGEGFIWH